MTQATIDDDILLANTNQNQPG